jgi:MerR family copper efflux transcriptional regulator
MLIGELAKLTGMSKDGIRHYEQLGLLASVPREAGNRTYRDYDASALELVERVRQAQRLGLSLAEIAPLLDAYGKRTPSKEETIHFLQDRLNAVRAKIEALRDVEVYIVTKLKRYRTATRSER